MDIYLTFLGPPRLLIDGQPADIKSRKGMALLAYLALHDSPQSRDSLAALLWPEFDQIRARANLRRTLFNLSKTEIGELLVTTNETIALASEQNIDVREFQQLSDDVAGLERSAMLYKGDFLDAFFLRDSEPFDEWSRAQQARLRRTALARLSKLTEHHLNNESFIEAISFARQQLDIDNLREIAWQQLIMALAHSGNRTEALSSYEECYRTLSNELGIEPAVELQAFVASVRQQSPTSVPDSSEPVPSPSPQSVTVPGKPYRGLFAYRERRRPAVFWSRNIC